MDVLVLGVGNPILGDDGAGIEVARRLEKRLRNSEVDVKEAATGGVPLIEQMVGYDRVLLVDAFLDADRGEVVMLTPDSLTNKESFSGVHDMDLVSSLQAIRSVYGGQLPPDEQIFIYGIGIDKTTKFSEGLSEEVEEAVQEVVDSVISDLSASSEVGYES